MIKEFLSEIPELYDVAKQVSHEHGMAWTDPRTGITHQPPKKRKKVKTKSPKKAHAKV